MRQMMVFLRFETHFSSFSRADTFACRASRSSCCSSSSRRTLRRTPSKRSTSPSLSSTWRFKAFTRRDSWGRRGRRLEGNRGGGGAEEGGWQVSGMGWEGPGSVLVAKSAWFGRGTPQIRLLRQVATLSMKFKFNCVTTSVMLKQFIQH